MSWSRDDQCANCTCPRWEHWRERLCFDWDLLALSNACDYFQETSLSAATPAGAAPSDKGEQ